MAGKRKNKPLLTVNNTNKVMNWMEIGGGGVARRGRSFPPFFVILELGGTRSNH